MGCLFTPTDKIENITSVNVFPNPTSSTISIECDGTIREVNVINLEGKLLKRHNTHVNVLDCTSFDPGLYFLHIYTHKGKVVRKIVVQ